MKKQLIVPGHTLEDEGRLYSDGRLVSSGVGICAGCGERSPDILPSASARQRWHTEHKQKIQEEREAEFDQRIRDADPMKETV